MFARRLITSTLIVLSLLCLPINRALALTAVVDTVPAGLTDYSAFVPPGITPAGVEVFAFGGTPGAEYTGLVFDVDEKPGVLVLLGADINQLNYNAGTGLLTIDVSFTGFAAGANPFPPGPAQNSFLVGMADSDWDQIPAEARTAIAGSWMATDILDWEIIPPSAEQQNPAFGYTIRGPAGGTGNFTMFIPQGILDLISQYTDGKNLTLEDLAVFEDGTQVSTTITQVTGGALVEIQVTFPAAATIGGLAYASTSKQVTVQEKQSLPRPTATPSPSPTGTATATPTPTATPSAPITLSADKTTAAKKEPVTFSGILQAAAENTRVNLKCNWPLSKKQKKRLGRKKGKKNYKLKTDVSGAFSKTIKMKAKKIICRANGKSGGKNAKSDKVTVTQE